MQRTIRLVLTSSAIISLALLFLVIPADVNAQVTSPQLSEINTKVTGIVQDTQAAVTKWNNGYFAGSLQELELNPGIAATGPYSTLISGASLQTKEMPNYGPNTGIPIW